MESEISTTTLSNMRKTVGWIQFYAVILALGAVFLIIFSSVAFLNPFMMAINSSVGILLILASIIAGMMSYFLFSYANGLKKASVSGDMRLLENGFGKYKFYFFIVGFFTILSAIWTIYSYYTTYQIIQTYGAF